jgi:hypothetical protein
MEVRTDIESSFSIIKQQVSELIQKGEFSFEILSIRLGRHTKEINLRTAFELKMKELEDNEQASTYLNYRSALKSLECFGGTNIPLDRITVEWLKHCERFWISNGKSYSSVSIYFRTLKCILNRAVRDGILKESSFPFGKNKYEIPEGHGRKLALTLPEIKRVMSFQDSTNKLNDWVRKQRNFGDEHLYTIHKVALLSHPVVELIGRIIKLHHIVLGKFSRLL